MKKDSLDLGAVHIENVTQRRTSVIAAPGWGKSNTLKMLAYKAPVDLPCYIFDPLGKIEIEGFQLLRITKKTAVDEEQIKKIAVAFRKLNDTKIIFSFKELLQSEIVLFINSFFRYWKPKQHSLVFADEIQDITPNTHMGQEYSEEFERAVRHWRNDDIGWIYATQRPSYCSTKVLGLTDMLILGRVSWKQDVVYVKELLGNMLTERELDDLIKKIQTKGFLEGYSITFL